MNFFKYYLQLLVPLLVSFAGYQLLVTPLFEPIHAPKQSAWVNNTVPKREGLEWWEPFFREDSWQRNSPLIIQQEQCILLYQKREQLSDTRWRFSPLTIVIPQQSQGPQQSKGKNGDGSSKRAIFIENPRGAEIQFKHAFDWTVGHPPPVTQGQLSGSIQIYSPADPETGQGELHIETEDVRIDKRQIWTDKPIKMRLGGSRIEGRYLSIFMDQDLLAESTPTSAVKPPDTPFAGLDYLQLFYVDNVRFELQNGGLWPDTSQPQNALLPAYAKLDCRGRFQFQFHQAQATFMDGVHMEHIVEGKPIDTFDCNELRLTVHWDTATHAPAANPPVTNTVGTNAAGTNATGGASSSNAWKLQRLEAIGLPGRDANDQSRWIRLKAPGMQAEANGQHLVMDLLHGMISLSNVMPGAAPKNSSRVFLRRENIQVTAPSIQYQNPELLSGQTTGKLTRLGWVLADGIGQAQIEAEEGELWNLRWSKRLAIRPHEQRDLISIEGGANISSSRRGRFVAEKLNLWVLPVDPSLATKLAPYYPDGKLPLFVPDSISAEGQVIVNATELNAQVESMAVRFRHLDPEEARRSGYSVAATPVQSKSPNRTDAQRTDAQRTQTSNVPLPIATLPTNGLPASGLTPPGLIEQPNQLNRPTNKPTGVSPMSVTGKTLDADILRFGGESVVENLSLDGNFTLTREFVSKESPWPLTATGDRLVIQSESNDRSNVYLVGQPAKIAVGSGWVIAKELQLSQNDQLFWINHPGELVIPQEALVQEPTERRLPDLPGTKPTKQEPWNWKSPPRIQWGERMTFDGRNARFGGGVTLDCRLQTDPSTLWHLLANARTMTLDMSQRVPFQIPTASSKEVQRTGPQRSEQPRPEVQVLRFDGEVDIKAVQTDLAGVRKSAENLVLPRLEFQIPSRSWVGYGPGQLWSRRFANDAALPDPTLKPGVGNTLNTSSGRESLQCLHLTFVGRMEGSIPQKMVSFYDKIAALLGPIATWEDYVDVKNAERLAKHQTRLFCDQLNLFDASSLSYNRNANASPNGTWELDALGAAQLTSRTDTGDVILDASRIGYAAANDAVRIEGSIQRPATIRRLSTDGSNDSGQSIQVSSASMRLKTGQIDAQIRKIEGGLPANMQPPLPGGNSPGASPNGARPPGSNPALGPTLPNSGVLPSARDFNPLQPRGTRP